MSIKRAQLPPAVRRAIVEHARQDAPSECCGFLIGRGNRIMFSLPTRNADSRPRTGFQIDPAEHVAIRRTLRAMVPHLEIIGVYHSHPDGPAVPSPRDIAESNYPDWLFVIIGARATSVRAYRIARHGVTPVALGKPQRAPRRPRR